MCDPIIWIILFCDFILFFLTPLNKSNTTSIYSLSTDMLRTLLHPNSDSHQYSPLSNEKTLRLIQEDPFGRPQLFWHGTKEPVEVFLFTLQLVKFPGAPQVRLKDSYGKNWVLSGWMVSTAAVHKGNGKQSKIIFLTVTLQLIISKKLGLLTEQQHNFLARH